MHIFFQNFFQNFVLFKFAFNIFFFINWLKIIISHAPLHAYEYGLFNWHREKSIVCYTGGKWVIFIECKVTQNDFSSDFSWKSRIRIRAMAHAKLIIFINWRTVRLKIMVRYNCKNKNWKKIFKIFTLKKKKKNFTQGMLLFQLRREINHFDCFCISCATRIKLWTFWNKFQHFFFH